MTPGVHGLSQGVSTHSPTGTPGASTHRQGGAGGVILLGSRCSEQTSSWKLPPLHSLPVLPSLSLDAARPDGAGGAHACAGAAARAGRLLLGPGSPCKAGRGAAGACVLHGLGPPQGTSPVGTCPQLPLRASTWEPGPQLRGSPRSPGRAPPEGWLLGLSALPPGALTC